MKKMIVLAMVVSLGFLSSKLNAQNAINPGEKAAITFFDFDFAAGYFGYKSVKIDDAGPNTLENRTLHQILRLLEADINAKYGITLEPAKYDSTNETKWITAKAYPKIKKKDALTLGYDKIVEIRAYMRPSAAMSIGGYSAPKPVMWLNLKVFDKAGKEIFDTSAQLKAEDRQNSFSIGGFQATGGFTGASIFDLYKGVLEKVFNKAEAKSAK